MPRRALWKPVSQLRSALERPARTILRHHNDHSVSSVQKQMQKMMWTQKNRKKMAYVNALSLMAALYTLMYLCRRSVVGLQNCRTRKGQQCLHIISDVAASRPTLGMIAQRYYPYVSVSTGRHIKNMIMTLERHLCLPAAQSDMKTYMHLPAETISKDAEMFSHHRIHAPGMPAQA